MNDVVVASIVLQLFLGRPPESAIEEEKSIDWPADDLDGSFFPVPTPNQYAACVCFCRFFCVCVCVSVCACGWAPPLNEMLFVIIIIINRRLQPDGWPRKSAADRPWMAFVLRAAVPSVGGQKKTDQLLLWFTFNWMHFVEIKLVRLVSTRLIRRIQKFKFVGRWRWRQ